MSLSFTISPNQQLIAEYQRILVSDWDFPQLRHALELARDTLREAGLHIHFRWEPRLTPQRRGSPRAFQYIIPPEASEDVAEYISNLNKQKLHNSSDLQSALQNVPSPELRQTEEAVFYLSLPSERGFRHRPIAIIDETGFYRDVRSLIFRLSVEHLLPALYSKQTNYLDFLAATLDEFARTEWDDQPEHRNSLLADLYEQLGRNREAAIFRDWALQATAPDSHDYLTKAQALVHNFLETGDIEAAEHTIFRVIRQTDGEHDRELRTMLHDIQLAKEVVLARRA
jgi:hypothetical protein